MEPKGILYRGMPMAEEWPAKIQAAQSVQSRTFNGQPIRRIPYGSEADDWGADEHACHDCGAVKGEFHVPGCDAEECPVGGGQLLSCDCAFDDLADN